MALRHVRRLLQRAEIHLGREGTAQAASFPELRNEIVALRKLEQEQREVASRIAQIQEALKQLDDQRKTNSRAQADELAKLETEKKPLVQRQNEAKQAAAVCQRELTEVDARLSTNDAADRELLGEVTALQAQAPPPEDLDARMASLAARRARLPAERGEILRAREGAVEACHQAKQKLTVADEELANAERNIARVREQYEATDRALNEKARGRQEALREAQAQHQTVEERKDPAYLNIGRHLATEGIAPPDAPHLLHDVLRHRQSVERHVAHTEELRVLSGQIDKQELRRFYFVLASLLVLLAIILPLVFQSPARREWLPQTTDAILSLNTERFEGDDLPRKWRNEPFWQQTWPGLIGDAAQTPRLRIPADTARITRALVTSETANDREFLLVDARNDVSPVVRTISEDKDFERRTISGLPVWQHANFTVARIGPKTLAVGNAAGVDQLVRVRLGIAADLQLNSHFFDRFQALDRDSTLRLVSRDPAGLGRAFHPIFARELLERSEIIGIGVALQNPVKARLVLKASSAAFADEISKGVAANPGRWLYFEGSDLPYFDGKPDVDRREQDIVVRFNMPENSARLLLQRIAKTDTAAPVTSANP